MISWQRLDTKFSSVQWCPHCGKPSIGSQGCSSRAVLIQSCPNLIKMDLIRWWLPGRMQRWLRRGLFQEACKLQSNPKTKETFWFRVFRVSGSNLGETYCLLSAWIPCPLYQNRQLRLLKERTFLDEINLCVKIKKGIIKSCVITRGWKRRALECHMTSMPTRPSRCQIAWPKFQDFETSDLAGLGHGNFVVSTSSYLTCNGNKRSEEWILFVLGICQARV